MESILGKRTGRLPGLDGLRAISALVVVLAHAGQRQQSFGSRRLFEISSFGAFGVDIFFILSGFIITHILLREEARYGNFSIKQFYLRRILRILPPAYCYILVISILISLGLIRLEYSAALAAAGFYMNFYIGDANYLMHYWSLSVEEQFYLTWPVLLYFLPKTHRLKFCLSACAILPLWKEVCLSFIGRTRFDFGRPDFRYSALMVGVTLALLWCNTRLKHLVAKYAFLHGYALPILIACICGALYGQGKLAHGINFLLMQGAYWSVAAVITILVTDKHRPISRIFNGKPLAWIGKISFSLYLWQQLLVFYPLCPGWAGVLIGISLSFPVAALSYYLIEQPSQRIRERIGSREKKKFEFENQSDEAWAVIHRV